ncbi:HEPN domain-containing protein [Fuchsiella alkaliacetigena]|nr:HEPN domain-containing protein [Fuchsiella alkaliacetigena]
MKKAENDLKSAKGLLNLDLFDTSVYHAQQCAEKALKAFIIYKTKSFSKTHDLTKLIKVCNDIDNEFYQFKEHAKELTPYAVEYRYPGDHLMPEKEEVEEAIELAEEIFVFTKSKLEID